MDSIEITPQSVEVRERAQALLTTLNLLANASKSERFIDSSHSRKVIMSLSEPEREALPDRVSKSIQSKNRLLRAARTKFHDAYELGNGPTPMEDVAFMSGLGGFMAAYAGRKNATARNRYRKNLKFIKDKLSPFNLALDEDIAAAFFAINHPEVPIAATVQQPVQNVAQTIPAVKPEVEKVDMGERLTTAQKLQALRDDPRAGFLPASHAEKTKVLAFLDYMNNPVYPANIAHQFQEVFVRQYRKLELSRDEATATLMSIGFELGDFYLQAREQSVALSDLAKRIDECPNPKVTLAEELGDTHPGYAPLVRYLAILPIREKDTRITPFDPLRNKNNRKEQAFEGKHKTVEDSYTGEWPRPVVREWMTERIHELTIGELRTVVKEAAQNEVRRAAFWQARLYDTYAHGAVWRASKQVLMSVGLPLNPRELA